MKRKIVIAGSASLQSEVMKWKSYWDNSSEVIAYPQAIPKETFLQDYPNVHKEFFASIEKADVLFVMNENKKGIVGYIGAETFAEIVFGIAQNSLHNKHIEVILLQMPETKVQSFEEIELWLKLGWIQLFNK